MVSNDLVTCFTLRTYRLLNVGTSFNLSKSIYQKEQMNKYSRKHVFDSNGNLLPIEQRTYITNESYECVLIDGGTEKDSVIFRINEWESQAQMSQVRRLGIKYPYHPNVYGVGFIGHGKYTSKQGKDIKDQAYTVWNSMMQRSYCPKAHIKHPTYKDVTVCEEWHNFQIFTKWFYNESNYQEGWALDKDILSEGSKVYQPSNCVFIPSELNAFLAKVKNTNSSGVLGVSKRGEKWAARISNIHTGKDTRLGNFITIEEASNAYQTKRKEYCEVWKERLINVLPEHILNKIS